MSVELKPHQQPIVDKLHNGSILRGEVGSGKSFVALFYWFTKVCGGVVGDVSSMRTPTDLIIITTAKQRDSLDWHESFAKMGVSTNRENSAGYIQVTVDSWNNIDKYKGVKDAFFIFDEQRLVGAGAWTKAFIDIARHNKWILLSATPGDTWLDYIPVFLANGFYKNRTEFKRRHVVYSSYSKFPKVERYLEVGHLVQLRNSILVQMPFKRHTTREISYLEVEYDEAQFGKVMKDRWHVYENRPLKDVAELFRVMRKVVNTDASRMETVRQLIQKHPKLIVFYNFNYELESLRSLAHLGSQSMSPTSMKTESSESPNFVVSEWNGHKHEPVPDTERWVYLVQYTAGAEGWNCITTDAMVFYSLPYSYKLWHQSFGRIDRLNTPFTVLKYYVLISKSVMDKVIIKALGEKRSFNESSWKVAA